MLSKEEQNDFYKQLGIQIKNSRNKLKVSQEDLAKQLGFVSRISIVQIESGKQKVQLHTLLEISEFLKIPLLDLLPPLDFLKKGISSALSKKISKEVSKEILDPITVEKIRSFIRLSTSKK